MKPLYTQKEFDAASSKDLLWLQCYNCNKPFQQLKCHIKYGFKNSIRCPCKFCSQRCSYSFRTTKKEIRCTNCNKLFLKIPSAITKNNFCSSSCSATYNNTHKAYGIRRSKLEIWLEQELTKKYPFLEIKYNKKEAINYELDIHIPSLSLAFEINGILHSEPIYGENKLLQIQINDYKKHQACIENKIELQVIDTLKEKFNLKNSQKHLNFIIKTINSKSG